MILNRLLGPIDAECRRSSIRLNTVSRDLSALIVANVSDSPQKFDVREGGKVFTASLDAGSVGTYVW